MLYTFPFEGNWNCLHTHQFDILPCLLYTFPFEGNWNSGVPFLFILDQVKYLLYTFPFEGNWNTYPQFMNVNTFLIVLLYTFPFEGNWNHLKGGYTRRNGRTTWLAIHVPVWRELKPFVTQTRGLHPCIPCYTRSRLKGIETLKHHLILYRQLNLLAIHVPVWRELKLPVACLLVICSRTILAIHVPVWRELKLSNSDDWSVMISDLLYTFPFEGNWNLSEMATYGKDMDTCYTRSRLKGIETLFIQTSLYLSSNLAIHVPVWRELKRENNLVRVDVMVPLAIHVPVWRELKQDDEVSCAETVPIHLLYTFPFEGNWNAKGLSIDIGPPTFLLYTFPFEGNWNLPERSGLLMANPSTCYTRSRLKGIETVRSFHICVGSVNLAIHVPVWRELKHGMLYFQKGVNALLLYTFPFEGNWNFLFPFSLGESRFGLLYTFPFEGNWNLNIRSLAKSLCVLLYTFPFEGNWNQWNECYRCSQRVSLLYTFPFEGNWNLLLLLF